MTKLLSYFRGERGRASKLACATGHSAAFLRQIAVGERPCPPKLAVKIEAETRGVVSRIDLCPSDWSDIWPEMRLATEQEGANA